MRLSSVFRLSAAAPALPAIQARFLFGPSLNECILRSVASSTRQWQQAHTCCRTCELLLEFLVSNSSHAILGSLPMLHRIRSIQGDKTILHNLQKATEITNGNTEKLAEWIVNSQRTDVGWLADKVDHQTAVQTIQNEKEFSAIKDMIQGGKKGLLFLNIQRQTEQIRSELRGS